MQEDDARGRGELEARMAGKPFWVEHNGILTDETGRYPDTTVAELRAKRLEEERRQTDAMQQRMADQARKHGVPLWVECPDGTTKDLTGKYSGTLDEVRRSRSG